jgi:hypothetical protein
MGKLLTLLAVVWLVGLLVCIQRFHHWNGEVDESIWDYYNENPDDRELTGDEFLVQQEAGRKMTVWLSGTLLWGAAGAAVLALVWRREREDRTDGSAGHASSD